jgi:hypothetical protein
LGGSGGQIDRVANIEQFLQVKREDILSIAARHGAYNVCVFGSVARGQADSASDVDFLVEVGPDHSAWFPSGLVLELEQLLGRKVEVVTERALHWYIRERILAEAIPL